MPKLSRVEVIQTGARRRWTLEEKQRIVAESNSGPRAVSATARRHGLSPSHLFWWRRLAREGRLCADDATADFSEAVVAYETPALRPVPAAGCMEIVLTNGLRVIVDQHVDACALMRVMSVVERR
jgi:transposase